MRAGQKNVEVRPSLEVNAPSFFCAETNQARGKAGAAATTGAKFRFGLTGDSSKPRPEPQFR
jgi:hypothetical protein